MLLEGRAACVLFQMDDLSNYEHITVNEQETFNFGKNAPPSYEDATNSKCFLLNHKNTKLVFSGVLRIKKSLY